MSLPCQVSSVLGSIQIKDKSFGFGIEDSIRRLHRRCGADSSQSSISVSKVGYARDKLPRVLSLRLSPSEGLTWNTLMVRSHMAILYIVRRISVGMLVKLGLGRPRVARVDEWLELILLEFVRLRTDLGSVGYMSALIFKGDSFVAYWFRLRVASSFS